jgi:hypothetical protein
MQAGTCGGVIGLGGKNVHMGAVLNTNHSSRRQPLLEAPVGTTFVVLVGQEEICHAEVQGERADTGVV